MVILKLVLYLTICVAEVFILKHFTISSQTIKKLRGFLSTSKGKPLSYFLPDTTEPGELIDRWAVPLDMELKFSKITYQKCRLAVLLNFVLINYAYQGFETIAFGTSDFELTSKHGKSIYVLIALVVLIVFR
jgi:hypothetical protein